MILACTLIERKQNEDLKGKLQISPEDDIKLQTGL
jgi:hypothetical protein